MDAIEGFDARVIQCLQDFKDELHDEQCKGQVHKLTERAAQDIRFDEPLAEACFDDRQKLCSGVQPVRLGWRSGGPSSLKKGGSSTLSSPQASLLLQQQTVWHLAAIPARPALHPAMCGTPLSPPSAPVKQEQRAAMLAFAGAAPPLLRAKPFALSAAPTTDGLTVACRAPPVSLPACKTSATS